MFSKLLPAGSLKEKVVGIVEEDLSLLCLESSKKDFVTTIDCISRRKFS